jgi:hypothetical protein
MYQEGPGADELTPEQRRQNVLAAFDELRQTSDSFINCEALDLTLDEFKELAEILKSKNFETLILRYNGINTSYIETLQKIILNNPDLKKIDLQGNQIDDEAISKLLDNKTVCDRLPNIYIVLTINPVTDKGVIEGTQYMSPHTIGMMTSNAKVNDTALVSSISNAVGKYLRKENKEESSLPFNLFLFKQLEADSQIDKLQNLKLEDQAKNTVQASKSQNNNVTNPTRKNS